MEWVSGSKESEGEDAGSGEGDSVRRGSVVRGRLVEEGAGSLGKVGGGGQW